MRAGSIKSEQLKFVFNKWIVLTAVSSGIFIPAMALILNPRAGEADLVFAANQLLESFYLGQVGFVVMSALYFGQELLNHAVRTSLLCAPDRRGFLFSKIFVLIGCEAVCIVFFSAVSLAAVCVGFHLPFAAGTALALLRPLIPCHMSIFHLSLIEAALIVLCRSAVFPLAAVVSMILGLGQLLLQFCGQFSFLPVLSVMNSFSTAHSPAYPDIPAGLLIQSAWCVLLWAAAFLSFKNRCVR